MIVKPMRFRDSLRVLSRIAVALLISGYAFEVDCDAQFTNPENLTRLIFAQENRIYSIEPNGDNIIELATSVEPTNPTFSCERNTLYWIENGSKIRALKYNESQSSNVILNDEASLLKSIALDFIADKLYIGNEFCTIDVVDLKTGYRGIIRSEKLPAIDGLAVDPNEGYLFAHSKFKLIRTDLDGMDIRFIHSQLTEGNNTDYLIEAPSIKGIQLDSVEKRVYWMDDTSETIRISSCNYNGTDRVLHSKYRHVDEITKRPPIPPQIILPNGRPFKYIRVDKSRKPPTTALMAYLLNIPYWIDYNQGVIRRTNSSNANDTKPIYKGKANTVSSINSIDCRSVEHRQTMNPCEKGNGGCQHLCVLSRSSESKHRCFCKIGYELADDGKSCILPTKFIAFTQDGRLRGINWREDTRQFIDVLNPSRRSPGDLTLLDVDTQKGIIYYQSSFDYNDAGIDFYEGLKLISRPDSDIVFDYDMNQFFNKSALINHRNLHAETLNDKNTTLILQPDFMAKEASDIAFDWASQNLYYYTHYYGWDDRTLNVMNLKNPTYSKILARSHWFEFGLAVHPNRGYVYYIETQNTLSPTSRIFRIHADGSNWMVLHENKTLITSIAVDYNEDQLYWSEHQRDFSIGLCNSILYYSNLDGKRIRKIETSLCRPSRMAFHGDWIYTISYETESLDRVVKKGGDPETLILSPDLQGLSMFDPSLKTTRSDHPCVSGESICDKFCFAVPLAENATSLALKRVCGCPYGEKLANDGRSCVDNSGDEPPLVPCRPHLRHCVNPYDKQTLARVSEAYTFFLGGAIDF